MKSLEHRIKTIEKRNNTVEIDKAWETSISRKIVIGLITYITIFVLFVVMEAPDPLVNALVATLAFVLSTMTLPIFRRLWVQYIYNR